MNRPLKSWKKIFICFIRVRYEKKKCISKFQCWKIFEMEHLNNKVSQLLLQHKGVVSWLKTW